MMPSSINRKESEAAQRGTDQGQNVEKIAMRVDNESGLSGCGALHPIVQITPAGSVQRQGTGCHGWFVESVHAPVGKKLEFRFQGPVHLLAMCNEGNRRNGETSVEGIVPSRVRNLTRKLTFVPTGYTYREQLETVASTRMAFIYLDPSLLPRDRQSECSPRIHFEDSVVWETAAKLKGAIENGRVERTSYLAALSNVLALELSRPDHNAVHETTPNCGGLASWQERAVAGYIEEHLGEQMSLGALARLARLSKCHFCRAFRRSFGIPPHQYHVQRRVERAKLLLVDSAITITSIGLTLGYSQTSSFSTVFRNATGWAPREYRKKFK